MKSEKIFMQHSATVKDLPNTNYWKLPVELLNSTLSKFLFAARNTEGGYYTCYRVSTMKHIRYALNRCLQCHGHGYDRTNLRKRVSMMSAFGLGEYQPPAASSSVKIFWYSPLMLLVTDITQ